MDSRELSKNMISFAIRKGPTMRIKTKKKKNKSALSKYRVKKENNISILKEDPSVIEKIEETECLDDAIKGPTEKELQ